VLCGIKEGNINLEMLVPCVKNKAKEVVVETKSRMPENKETWWWNDEI